MEYLLATRNQTDLMDMTIHYGMYIIVQNVLRNFDNAIDLERMTAGPTIIPEITAEEEMTATYLWERELDLIIKKLLELDLGPPSESELKRYGDYEKLLDNPNYQP
jgi:hypothetical protein